MNIIQLLNDHLPEAIEDLDEQIEKAYNTIALLESRRLQLQRIANAAGISIDDAPRKPEVEELRSTRTNALGPGNLELSA